VGESWKPECPLEEVIVAPSPLRRTRPWIPAVALALVVALPATSPATHTPAPAPPPCIDTSFLTLDVPGSLKSIVCSGQMVGFEFPGIPDGIGVAPGPTPGTVDVYVNHEESEVPFPAPPASNAQGDFQDSSVSKLTLDRATGALAGASVALPETLGFMRLCSATMAGPAEGFDNWTFFTNEETDDVVDVDPGAPYGPDPSVAPKRQGGYSVVLDEETGDFTHVPGMGRHNHENTTPVPGGWKRLAILSTDDTFTATTSQLYLYLAKHERHIWQDKGSLWAFQVTRTDEGPVDPFDPFNEANDYLDLEAGERFQGRFIRVPKDIARGLTADRPQTALENWSNANNVFQFVRLEDIDYDRSNHRVVYIADTGATRVVPNPATGRMHRPSGVMGQADNGSIFRFKFDKKNPRKVTSLTLLVDADIGGPGGPDGAMHQPDNVGASEDALMVQEDAAPPSPNSRIWRYDFGTQTWDVVAHVNESDWESSGIVEAGDWLAHAPNEEVWLLDVQGHGEDDWVRHENPTVTRPWFLKLESGQVLLMKLQV
jgi:Bacterial protein of unknown function (DUF839)